MSKRALRSLWRLLRRAIDKRCDGRGARSGEAVGLIARRLATEHLDTERVADKRRDDERIWRKRTNRTAEVIGR
jgi:hypothetical protein